MPKEIWKCVDCDKPSKPYNKGHFKKEKSEYRCRSCTQKGKHPPIETRNKMSQSKLGKKRPPHTEETKRKMSEAQKGEKNHLFGKTQSQEIRDKQSASLKGKPKSDITKYRQSLCKRGDKNPMYGVKYSDEYKQKQSLSHKGMKMPESAVIKTRESRFGGFWYGAVTYAEYIPCPLLTNNIKQQNRDRFGHCVLCGCLPKDNIDKKDKIWSLAVHHALEESMAFCNEEKGRKETLRKMMPTDIAQFDAPTYSKEELWYVRLLVPLCIKCHGKVTRSDESNKPYEETKYRKFFCELVINEYEGKCI